MFGSRLEEGNNVTCCYKRTGYHKYVGGSVYVRLIQTDLPLILLCTYRFKFVIQLKQYGYYEHSSWRPQVVLNTGHCRTAKPWMLVYDENPRTTKRSDNLSECCQCPDASTCPLHCTTFNTDGYSELTVTVVENSNSRVGCNPNKMVTSLNWAWASAWAYSTGLRNVFITPSNSHVKLHFMLVEVSGEGL